MQPDLPVIEQILRPSHIGELGRIQDKREIGGMTRVVVRQTALSADIARIARLGRSVEVLCGSNQFRERISTMELYVVREPFVQVDDQPVIGRCPTVFLCADRCEARIGSDPK